MLNILLLAFLLSLPQTAILLLKSVNLLQIKGWVAALISLMLTVITIGLIYNSAVNAIMDSGYQCITGPAAFLSIGILLAIFVNAVIWLIGRVLFRKPRRTASTEK